MALAWNEAELTLAGELGRLLGHDLGPNRKERKPGRERVKDKGLVKEHEELGDTKWSLMMMMMMMMMTKIEMMLMMMMTTTMMMLLLMMI